MRALTGKPQKKCVHSGKIEEIVRLEAQAKAFERLLDETSVFGFVLTEARGRGEILSFSSACFHWHQSLD